MNDDPNRSEDEDSEDEEIFPWDDVEAARRNTRLQRKYTADKGRKAYLHMARPCPECGTPAEQLAWFYFESPEWTWRNLFGRAGWMVACDPCRRQTDFFMDRMN